MEAYITDNYVFSLTGAMSSLALDGLHAIPPPVNDHPRGRARSYPRSRTRTPSRSRSHSPVSRPVSRRASTPPPPLSSSDRGSSRLSFIQLPQGSDQRDRIPVILARREPPPNNNN